MRLCRSAACGLMIISALGLAVGGAGAAGRDEGRALADRVRAAYKNTKNLVADYTRQSTFVAMAGQAARKVRGAGKITWARPYSLRLVQATPRKEIIICDGRNAWWALPSRKRADLYAMNTFTAGLRSLLEAIGGLTSLDLHYNLGKPSAAEAAQAQGALTLVLLPKKARADLKRLVLWFEKKRLVLVGFRLVSMVEDVTDYRFSRVRINQKVSPATFQYRPPKGFRVVDHRPVTPPGREAK